MNRSTSFEIFKRNQVLFIEVGIIYVVLLCFMLFLPLGGATYAISSVILFWIFTSPISALLVTVKFVVRVVPVTSNSY